MYIEVLNSKIYRVSVTQAELHYIGSVTMDLDLMDAVGLLENEKVTKPKLSSQRLFFRMKTTKFENTSI